MEQEQFKSTVESQIAELKEKYGYSEDVAFVHWCTKQIYGTDDDASEEACEIGGSNDKGIDALWVEEGKGRAIIVQGKYSKVNRIIDRKEISNLKAIPELLLDREYVTKQKNRELREKATDYRDAMANNCDTELVLCVFGEITPGAKEEAEQFNKNSKERKITIRCYDFKGLMQVFLENLTRDQEVVGPEKICLVPDQYFEKTDTKNKSVIGTVEAKELSRIAKKYNYSLFQKNIRSYLSERDKYNKKILETLRGPNKYNFWHYNNGISIVCDSYEIDKEQNTIKLENMQIVNGCQTTNTILVADREYGALDANVHVLVRIIASKDEAFTEKITETTNSQAEIKSRDFRSNDDIQRILQGQINALGKYIYTRKRGEDKTISSKQKRGKELIDMESASQAILAFILEKPAEAKSEKSRIYAKKSDGGYYDEIFPNERSPLEVILSTEIYELVHEKRKEWNREKKKIKEQIAQKKSAGQDADELIKKIEQNEYRLHSDYHVVALIHHLLLRKYEKLNDDILKKILNDDQYDKIIGKLYEKATIMIKNMLWEEISRDVDFSHTKFFKSTQNYNRIKEYCDLRIEELETVTSQSIFDGVPFPE